MERHNPTPELLKKLARLNDETGYMEKDQPNKAQGYRYVSAMKVLTRIREALSNVKLVSTVTSSIEHVEVVSRTLPDGKVAPSGQRVIVKSTLYLWDPESDGWVSSDGCGSGYDVGDKAVMKAETAALKYAWMKLLNIPTGDDPEADERTDKEFAEPTPAKPVAQSRESRVAEGYPSR